jgi:hypothetical protein
MNLHPQLKNPNVYIMILSDALIFVFAIVLAYLFRQNYYQYLSIADVNF